MIYKHIDDDLNKNNISPKQLAATLGISESYMCMLRLGKRRPGPKLALRMEAETGVPFKKLLLNDAVPQKTRNVNSRRKQAK